MAYDTIIRGGTLLDGTGGPGVTGDIAIQGDRIAAVGDLEAATAAREIDAAGSVVTPGLIDAHTHADKTMMLYPGAENYRAQGITTVVGGNCGSSPAPLTDYYLQGYWEWNWWHDINPRAYYDEVVADLPPVIDAMKRHEGLDLDWRTFGEFFARLAEREPGVNLVPLVGHNAVRGAVMGRDYRRAADAEEIERMRTLVRDAMQDGVVGISNGLDYAPGGYADRREMVALVKEAANHDGIFTSHWRRTGLRYGMGNPVLIKGLREALEIAREAGAPLLQISHVLNGYSIFPESPDELLREAARLTLNLLDEAIEDGLNLYWDVIPNTNGGTLSGRYLAAGLAPWLKMSGSLEQLARNLAAPDYRKDVRDYLEAGKWYPLNPLANPGWAAGLVVASHPDESLIDRSVADIAAARGTDSLGTLFDLIAEYPESLGYPAPGSETAHRVFFEHPRTMVALDTFSVDDTYEVYRPPYLRPHPNTYGGMVRYFERFGRPLLGMEEAVRRVTGLPAEVFGLRDRGILREGKRADIAVWNPDNYRDRSSYAEPRRYAEGVEYLFVNGTLTLSEGRLLPETGGRILTR